MRKLALAALLLACACGTRLQKVFPQLVPPPDSHDFGAIPVLNEKVDPIEVRNVGRADLQISNVHIVETGVPITLKDAPSVVGTGGTENITISCKPPAEQDYAATLSFDTNDADNPTVTVALTCKGSTKAVMEVNPTSIDFGRVGECTSAVKNFVIKDTGTADLILTDISFADGTSPAFSFVGSTKTPATVKATGSNGLPGQITLTVKYSVTDASAGPATGAIRIRGTDPDHQEVLIPLTGTPNKAPVPTIAPLGNGAPGMTVQLDGSGSADPDGDNPITYHWTLSAPLGANTTIAGPDQPTTSMTLDPLQAGTYTVTLQVTDSTGVKACTPAKATIVATPAQKLLVEMFWDNAKTDLDLHLLRTPTTTVGDAVDDCYYEHPKPDWGTPGDPQDDPSLLKDALTGYGPEVIGYQNPINGTFRVIVEFTNSHFSPTPASTATVRVYEYGVVKAEQTHVLSKQGEFWAVVDIEWPSGNITPLQ